MGQVTSVYWIFRFLPVEVYAKFFGPYVFSVGGQGALFPTRYIKRKMNMSMEEVAFLCPSPPKKKW
jgi:hypothetical protein